MAGGVSFSSLLCAPGTEYGSEAAPVEALDPVRDSPIAASIVLPQRIVCVCVVVFLFGPPKKAGFPFGFP